MAKGVINQEESDEKKEQEVASSPNMKSAEESHIPDELKPFFADPSIPPVQKQRVLSVLIAKTSFSGPVPPPALLQGYNDVLENGAERIVTMAEKQSMHRMQLEDHAVKEGLKQSRLGQTFGFIIGLVVLVLATLLAYLGHDVVAGIFGGSTIVGLVAVFVIGKIPGKRTGG